MATRPEIEVSGTAARHSRVTSSTTSSTRKRWPLANWSWTKSSDPAARQRFACIPREGACNGLRLDQDRNVRSDSFAPGLPLAHRQPFLAVKAIDPVDAGRLSLTPQQNEEPPPLGIMLRMTLRSADTRTAGARWPGPATDRAALCPAHAEIDRGSSFDPRRRYCRPAAPTGHARPEDMRRLHASRVAIVLEPMAHQWLTLPLF